MSHLAPLLVAIFGIAATKLMAMVFGLRYEYALLTALLVAAPLIVVETLLMSRLPAGFKRLLVLDGTPFPWFTLGCATGIVLVGRGLF